MVTQLPLICVSRAKSCSALLSEGTRRSPRKASRHMKDAPGASGDYIRPTLLYDAMAKACIFASDQPILASLIIAQKPNQRLENQLLHHHELKSTSGVKHIRRLLPGSLRCAQRRTSSEPAQFLTTPGSKVTLSVAQNSADQCTVSTWKKR